MAERSVHEAAVDAGAAGLCGRVGEGCPAHHLCEAEAQRVIAALVTDPQVRKALDRRLLAARGWAEPDHPAGPAIRTGMLVDVFLAALGGTNERGDA